MPAKTNPTLHFSLIEALSSAWVMMIIRRQSCIKLFWTHVTLPPAALPLLSSLPPSLSLPSCVILLLLPGRAAAVCPHHSSLPSSPLLSPLHSPALPSRYAAGSRRQTRRKGEKRRGRLILSQAGFARFRQWMEFIGQQPRWLPEKWVSAHRVAG